MPPSQEKTAAYIKHHKQDMLSLLESLVLIQSGTRNKPGVDMMATAIEQEMTSLGFSCERVKNNAYGDHVIARSPDFDSQKKQILITGHMDTVFPHDTSFNYFKQEDGRCVGPGVADMKGGLVVGMAALKALIKGNGAIHVPITFVFNSDEEVGSPLSRDLIRKEARKSRAAFVLEMGGLNGDIVTGRKGNLSARLTITGKAGHAAFAGADKASAILELAHKIIEIENLNDPAKGITANVGIVKGGIGPNTIAQHASARMDFRFLRTEDSTALKSKLTHIIGTPFNPKTSSELTIVSSRPAMPETPGNLQLFEQIKVIADHLDIPVRPDLRQGVSDANIIADEGVCVIDGLGPCGAKDHSDDEYIQTSSLMDRTLLFASILENLKP